MTSQSRQISWVFITLNLAFCVLNMGVVVNNWPNYQFYNLAVSVANFLVAMGLSWEVWKSND